MKKEILSYLKLGHCIEDGDIRVKPLNIRGDSAKDLMKIKSWKQDKDLCRGILAHPKSLTDQEIRDWHLKNSTDPNQLFMGVYYFDGELELLIGLVRLMYIDWDSGTAELGVFIGEAEMRGRGLGKKALKLFLDYSFNQLSLRKIYLRVAADNLVARKMYENFGFKQEGCLVKHFKTSDECVDVFIMALFA